MNSPTRGFISEQEIQQKKEFFGFLIKASKSCMNSLNGKVIIIWLSKGLAVPIAWMVVFILGAIPTLERATG